jgi:hypothetical protein
LLDQITTQIDAFRSEYQKELSEFKDTVQSGSLTVGDMKIAVYDKVPEHFLVCNGASLLIEDYQDLYNAIGVLYGQDDDYHFNLPDFRNRIPEGFKDTDEAFGSYQTGKVPNITGYFALGGSGAYFVDNSGAFYKRDGTSTRNQYQQDSGNRYMYFDASYCSDVYSNDATRVSVDRVKVNYLIKYKD